MRHLTAFKVSSSNNKQLLILPFFIFHFPTTHQWPMTKLFLEVVSNRPIQDSQIEWCRESTKPFLASCYFMRFLLTFFHQLKNGKEKFRYTFNAIPGRFVCALQVLVVWSTGERRNKTIKTLNILIKPTCFRDTFFLRSWKVFFQFCMKRLCAGQHAQVG